MRLSVFGRNRFHINPVGRYFSGVIACMLLLWSPMFLFSLAAYTYQGISAQRWQLAQATITLLELTTETVEIKYGEPFVELAYQFDVDGRRYKGDRLTFAGSTRYLKRLLALRVSELELAQKESKTVDCYYDPANPNRCVLDRRLLATVYFARASGLFLCLCGGSVLAFLATDDFRRQKRLTRMQTVFPTEPWKVRDDWATGHIRSSSRIDSRILVASATIYLVAILPLGLRSCYELYNKVLGGFGIGLIVLAWGAVNLIRRRWLSRFLDQSLLQLGAVPGIVGGPLYGSIRISKIKTTRENLRVALECLQIEFIDGESGEAPTTSENVLHREVISLDSLMASHRPDESFIPFYFAIPLNLPSSSADTKPSIHWLIKVGHEAGQGLGEYAQFEVPVFLTPDSSASFEANIEVMQPFKAPLPLNELLLRAGVRYQPAASGKQQIAISNFSFSTLTTGLIVVALLALIAAALLAAGQIGWSLVPGIVVAIVIVAVTSKLLWRSELCTGEDTLLATAGFPWWKANLEVAPGQLCGWVFDVEAAMKENSLYRIRLWTQEFFEIAPDMPHDKDDVQDDFFINYLTVARDLRSAEEAQMLIAWLSEKTGIAPSLPPEHP